MTTAFFENSTTIQFEFTRTADLPPFVEWLDDYWAQCEVVTQLNVGNDADNLLPLPGARISLCTLHGVVWRLPNLQGLHLRGLVLVECTIANHEHIRPPNALFLTTITLDRVATTLSPDFDPLDIIEFAPRLTSVRIVNCHSLIAVGYWTTGTPGEFGPLPFPPISLTVAFPTRWPDQRPDYWRSPLGWYDFAERISHERGNRVLSFENVHDRAAQTVATLINNAAGVVENLRFEFGRHFQSTLTSSFCSESSLTMFWSC